MDDQKQVRLMVFRSSLFVFLIFLLPVLRSASATTAEDQVVILPASFQLMYPGAEQQLILERRGRDGS